METPGDLRYSKEHEWVRLEDGLATIGITDFAQDQLGDIVFLDLPEPGASFEQFAKIGEIESVKSVSDLFTPVGGEVAERNQAALDTPEIVNQEPYGGGWLVRLRVTDPAQLDALLSAEEYAALTAEAQ
ncbi:MAG TPA: glycine cleavage system protein GcvH [Dehalococcoidia bacterium]|nr:glycine cleavage system protein GcvH [Dehalococcoidia bacterium]